ncbi:hypothetical protein [Rickettsiella endosymbiont of Aleochara curtula]|uniref:hypothetical protein n=1 Tax=Rickettsiella endosymbiont of Aleochara curtula TaxID=3077936 RepID=UPI00313C3000
MPAIHPHPTLLVTAAADDAHTDKLITAVADNAPTNKLDTNGLITTIESTDATDDIIESSTEALNITSDDAPSMHESEISLNQTAVTLTTSPSTEIFSTRYNITSAEINNSTDSNLTNSTDLESGNGISLTDVPTFANTTDIIDSLRNGRNIDTFPGELAILLHNNPVENIAKFKLDINRFADELVNHQQHYGLSECLFEPLEKIGAAFRESYAQKGLNPTPVDRYIQYISDLKNVSSITTLNCSDINNWSLSTTTETPLSSTELTTLDESVNETVNLSNASTTEVYSSTFASTASTQYVADSTHTLNSSASTTTQITESTAASTTPINSFNVTLDSTDTIDNNSTMNNGQKPVSTGLFNSKLPSLGLISLFQGAIAGVTHAITGNIYNYYESKGSLTAWRKPAAQAGVIFANATIATLPILLSTVEDESEQSNSLTKVLQSTAYSLSSSLILNSVNYAARGAYTYFNTTPMNKNSIASKALEALPLLANTSLLINSGYNLTDAAVIVGSNTVAAGLSNAVTQSGMNYFFNSKKNNNADAEKGLEHNYIKMVDIEKNPFDQDDFNLDSKFQKSAEAYTLENTSSLDKFLENLDKQEDFKIEKTDTKVLVEAAEKALHEASEKVNSLHGALKAAKDEFSKNAFLNTLNQIKAVQNLARDQAFITALQETNQQITKGFEYFLAIKIEEKELAEIDIKINAAKQLLNSIANSKNSEKNTHEVHTKLQKLRHTKKEINDNNKNNLFLLNESLAASEKQLLELLINEIKKEQAHKKDLNASEKSILKLLIEVTQRKEEISQKGLDTLEKQILGLKDKARKKEPSKEDLENLKKQISELLIEQAKRKDMSFKSALEASEKQLLELLINEVKSKDAPKKHLETSEKQLLEFLKKIYVHIKKINDPDLRSSQNTNPIEEQVTELKNAYSSACAAKTAAEDKLKAAEIIDNKMINIQAFLLKNFLALSEKDPEMAKRVFAYLHERLVPTKKNLELDCSIIPFTTENAKYKPRDDKKSITTAELKKLLGSFTTGLALNIKDVKFESKIVTEDNFSFERIDINFGINKFLRVYIPEKIEQDPANDKLLDAIKSLMNKLHPSNDNYFKFLFLLPSQSTTSVVEIVSYPKNQGNHKQISVHSPDRLLKNGLKKLTNYAKKLGYTSLEKKSSQSEREQSNPSSVYYFIKNSVKVYLKDCQVSNNALTHIDKTLLTNTSDLRQAIASEIANNVHLIDDYNTWRAEDSCVLEISTWNNVKFDQWPKLFSTTAITLTDLEIEHAYYRVKFPSDSMFKTSKVIVLAKKENDEHVLLSVIRNFLLVTDKPDKPVKKSLGMDGLRKLILNFATVTKTNQETKLYSADLRANFFSKPDSTAAAPAPQNHLTRGYK